MRLALLLAVLATLVFHSPRALAQDQAAQQVIEVRVAGNERMSATSVLSRVKTRVGATYDETIVKADEKRLLESGRFDTVQATMTATDSGVIVTFVVAERPTIKKLELCGNKQLKTADLLKEISFGQGDALNRYAVEAGRQALLTKYRASGYHFAEVGYDESLLGSMAVVYNITEGPQVRIRKIRMKGNDNYGTWTLKFKIESSARFWPFVNGFLDNELIERDVQTLRTFYVDEGYLDVEVGRLVEFSPDKRNAYLTFVIKEGPRFRVNTVGFRGNTIYNAEELRRRLKLTGGEYFTAVSLRRDQDALRDAYGQIGYMQAKVDSARQFVDPTAERPAWAKDIKGPLALVNLTFTITEADQYTIGKVDIRGNSATQERVIRRELRFFPEQLYNTVAVDESKKRLKESRLFEKVEITPVGSTPNKRDVLVQVEEARTAEFIIGVGVSSNDGLLGNVTLAQRNFDPFAWPESWGSIFRGQGLKGAGQTLRIVAEPGTEVMRFHVDWVEPYLMDQPYSLSNSIYYFTRGRESYDETRVGDVAGLGHRFKNDWYGEIAQRVETVRIDDLDRDAPPEVRRDKGDWLMLSNKGTLVRDRTDSRFNPSTGDRLKMSYEQFYGDAEFGRGEADYRFYRTVWVDALDRKHIVATRMMAGQIFGDAPVFERYYGGGIGSLRGFEYRGISPRSRGTDEPIGGEFAFFAGSEYTFPLVGEQLRGAVFLDSGTVEEDTGFGTYRVSTGLGIRWVIPLLGSAPMSLDFGFPLMKDGDDDTQILSFSLGWTF